MCLDVVGPQSQRLVVASQRLVSLALLTEDVAEIVVNFRLLGVDGPRLFVERSGFVQPFQISQQERKVHQRVHFRPAALSPDGQLQAFAVRFLRLGHLVLTKQGVAQVQPAHRLARFDLQRLPDTRGRLRQPILFGAQIAQHEPGAAAARFLAEQRAIDFLGLAIRAGRWCCQPCANRSSVVIRPSLPPRKSVAREPCAGRLPILRADSNEESYTGDASVN